MMKTMKRIYIAALMLMAAVPAMAQSLGSELSPKDSTEQRRFTNRLIAPKGEWQCGLAVMYADFNSSNADYMLILQ